MHQPQKRQPSRPPATQIQVSLQKSAEILSVHFSTELGGIQHTIPTNGMYNVGVFDSTIEGEAYDAQCTP